MKQILLAVTLLTAAAARAADIDVVRQQFLAYATAAGADRTTQRMHEAVGTLEWVARSHADALHSDGSWPDINYAALPEGDWGPWWHTQRLWILAKAYKTPGQALYRSPSLLADIDAALAYTKTFYGATVIPTGNWWFWTIGIPIDLGPTLVLMRGDVSQATYDDLVTAMHLRIGSSPTARGLVGPVPTGQNLVWSAYTHLCLALMKDDTAMLAAVRDAMASVARPTSLEGIKRDHSFHQHGAQLYTGGYGGQFANDVARYALITRGTAYGLPSDALESFMNYVADGIAWSLHGDYFDVSVISREVAPSDHDRLQRPRRHDPGGADPERAHDGDPLRPREDAPVLARHDEHRARRRRGTRRAGQDRRGVAVRPPPLLRVDYTIHRRPGWFASVKMFSTRTKSGEKTNDENILGSRQSDGRFYLVLRGNEYFGNDVWPAFDWARMPGTTVEQKAGTASAVYGYGTRTFAGGTGDGQNGVSAMELAPLDSVLFARKSWFFFDDAIVFLTNGIRSTSANRIETIVNQVHTSSTVTRRNDWAHLDDVGYWFPTPVGLQTTRETRSGTWASLGASTDTTAHTKPFTTLYLDHGTSPVNATAEYAIVPNITSTAMATWAASRPLSILMNNENLSAVRDTRTGNLGITFWRAAAVEGIQSSAPAVVYITRDDESMHIWAADPNAGASGSFTLTIPGNWETDDVSSTRTSRAIGLTIPKAAGQTTHVVLTPGPVKRRALRR